MSSVYLHHSLSIFTPRGLSNSVKGVGDIAGSLQSVGKGVNDIARCLSAL